MSRTFLWEAELMARKRAPEFLAMRGSRFAADAESALTPGQLVHLAFRGGKAKAELRGLVAQFRNAAYDEAVRRWAAWYRDVRGITSVSADEFLSLARSEQGTHPGVTKTKLRKVAGKILAGTLRAMSAA